jgi:hypothetical protein
MPATILARLWESSPPARALFTVVSRFRGRSWSEAGLPGTPSGRALEAVEKVVTAPLGVVSASSSASSTSRRLWASVELFDACGACVAGNEFESPRTRIQVEISAVADPLATHPMFG